MRVVMQKKQTHWLILTLLVLTAAMASSCCSRTTAQPAAHIPVYGFRVVRAYPHDNTAFTEGLAIRGDVLIEGTGLPGRSVLRRVDLRSGEILREHALAAAYFGEGITLAGDTIFQITEDSHTGFTYDLLTLARRSSFQYPTKGWGIAWDGNRLIMSDGTACLYFLDPKTFQQVGKIEVHAGNQPVDRLNELECVEGEIYANIWPTNRIARISPATGAVTGWIDLAGLLSSEDKKNIGWSVIKEMKGKTSIPFSKEACLNGIAYDERSKRLFVTGKLWPKLFEIEVTIAGGP